MDRKEFATGMAVLGEGCSGLALTEAKCNVWFDCLKDLDADVFHRAVKAFLLTDGEFPSIAKLRKLSADYAHGVIESQADVFGRVMACVHSFGYYSPDKARASMGEVAWECVRRLGGWTAFCDVTPDTRESLRAQFRQAYEGMADRERSVRALPENLRPAITASGFLSLPDIQRQQKAITDESKQPSRTPIVVSLPEIPDDKPEHLPCRSRDEQIALCKRLTEQRAG